MPSAAVGEPAPAFTLDGVVGGSRRPFTLADAAGAPLVLVFYPGDDTLTCTKQLCSYQDDLARFTDLGAAVWGISAQDLDSHERFAAKRSLTFPLLADPERHAIRAYGVEGPLGRTKRGVFVIDGAGILRWSHVSLGLLGYQDADTLAREVAALS